MNIKSIMNRDEYSIEETLDKIIAFLSVYEYSEVMKLFAYTNIKLNSEGVNSSGYKVSPRLSRNIPFVYVTKSESGNKRINNIDKVANQYIDLLDELTMCYTNIIDYSQRDSFHKSYLSYHLDYPPISIRQYFRFFHINRDIVGEVYKVDKDNIDDFIHSLFLLMNFERAWKKKFRFSPYANFIKWRNSNSTVKFTIVNIFYQLPVKMIKMLFNEFKIDCSDAINKLFLDSSSIKKSEETIYPTNIKKMYPQFFGLKNNKFVTFMRNLNVLNSVYEHVMNSEEFEKHKGDYLEERTEVVLKYMFGNDNVYHGIFDECGNEQDFIVIFNDYIISLECKASKFTEPFVNQDKAQKRLEQSFKKTIQKGYSQAERIAENFRKGRFKFYNGDKVGKRQEVLDISTYDIEKFQSVIVTMDQYHNLGTELHLSIKQSENINLPLVIDINSFEILLQKCKISYNIDKFIEYLDRRTEFYGLVFPANSDELDCFGYFLKYGSIMKGPIGNLFINIGPGYSSFVTDILEIDNFMIFNELYEI